MPSHHFSTNRFEQNLVYLDDYLDTLESLPAEMQRSFTLMQQLDASAQEKFDKVAELSVQLTEHIHELSPEDRVEQLKKLSNNLSATGRFAEERVSLATSTYDTVDRHIRRLDDDLQKFEDEQMTGPGRINASTAIAAAREEPRKQVPKSEKDKKEIKSEKRTTNGVEAPANKKRKTAKDTGTPPPSKNNGDKEREKPGKVSRKREGGKNGKKVPSEKSTTNGDTQTVADMPIDPNEPIYCYCKQVSYGEMVACDNNECEIEWFHFACVKLTDRPKGKWYCFECSEKVKQRHKK